MKPETINLTACTRYAGSMRTLVSFEDHDLKELFTVEAEKGRRHGIPWLKFGALKLDNEGRKRRLCGRYGNTVTDFEHDSAYAVCVELLSIEYEFTDNHVSHWRAVITTDPNEILIAPSGFDPKTIEGSWMCKSKNCDKPHLMLPDARPGFMPNVYEHAKEVAGKHISIVTCPAWEGVILQTAVEDAWSAFRARGGADPDCVREHGEDALATLQESLHDAFRDYEC